MNEYTGKQKEPQKRGLPPVKSHLENNYQKSLKLKPKGKQGTITPNDPSPHP